MDILLTVLLTAAGSYPQFYSLLSLNNLFLSKQSKSHPRQIPNATDDLKRRGGGENKNMYEQFFLFMVVL